MTSSNGSIFRVTGLFVRGIHRSPVNSPHKGQWRGVLMFSLICARINGWVNSREAGDLRRYRAHYDVIVMWCHKDDLPYKNLCNKIMSQHRICFIGDKYIDLSGQWVYLSTTLCFIRRKSVEVNCVCHSVTWVINLMCIMDNPIVFSLYHTHTMNCISGVQFTKVITEFAWLIHGLSLRSI